MTSRGQWVLVSEGLDGESRGTVAAVRALAGAGYVPAVTVSGPSSMAARSRHCARAVQVPRATEPGYADAIRAEMERGSYLAVLPTSDAALIALGAPVTHLLDKSTCSELARGNGIDVAPTRTFASGREALAAADTLDYPIVIKPAIKRYAATRVDEPARLAAAIHDDGPVLVQPFLDGEHHAVAGLMWKGRLVAAVHMRYVRMWPVPCGTVASAETIAPDEDLERALVGVLDGYDGLFHAEFLGPYLQDLNPRVHGTLPLAVASGVNLVARYCDLLQGRSVATHRGRAGVFFRWIEGDLRSALSAFRGGRADMRTSVRAVRPRRNTVHSYESFTDPGPSLARAGIILAKVRTTLDERVTRRARTQGSA